MSKLHVGLQGSTGRLGKLIAEQISAQPDLTFEPILRGSTFSSTYDVILDVSSIDGVRHMLKTLLDLKKYVPIIIGTTGELPQDLITEYSQHAPLALLSNFSIGVPQFLDFLKVLKEDNWETISMIERHHIHKKDAPSGTAKTLSAQLKRKIEIESVREGEIIGEHELYLDNPNERLVISHFGSQSLTAAKNRAIFAAGTLRYIRWLPTQRPGLYRGMERPFIKFDKYQGAGNDFVFVDNKTFPATVDKIQFVARVCPRGTSVGADGVIFVEDRGDHVYWEYFNADGSLVAMCGNGSRCVGTYALARGWAARRLINSHGIVQRFDLLEGQVRVEMPRPVAEEAPAPITSFTGSLAAYKFRGLFTVGVPHSVYEMSPKDFEQLGPNPVGQEVRKTIDVNTNVFHHQGTQVWVRTYERGVYDETLACGSGCCAVAWHLWAGSAAPATYRLTVRSGLLLTVSIEADGSVFLSGPVSKVYSATYEL